MAFNDLVSAIKAYYPSFQAKYKDQSTFMKILGKLSFFNPSFMSSSFTTIGDTVYIPNEQFVKDDPKGTNILLIHECTHMYDEKRIGFPYSLAYAFPQILAPLMLFLLFVLSWKIVLPLVLLFLLPLPAPWRQYFERRAYYAQMYSGYKMYNMYVEKAGAEFASFFRDSTYYFMWPFENGSAFEQEAKNIIAGQPYVASDPKLLAMIDDLMAAGLKP